MNLQTFTLGTALLAVIGAGQGAAAALELRDLTKAPSWYAQEVTEAKGGTEAKRVVFSAQPVAISMADLNAILSAYGLSVVDVTRAPDGYMRATEDGGDGGNGPAIVFDSQPRGMAPAAIDRILAAYGLRIVDARKLPPSYGREVVRKNAEGSDVREIELSQNPYAVSPVEWHQILSAYGQ